MKYCNQIEPDSLIKHFLNHPPLGFRVECTSEGPPVFMTPFDLLTTTDFSFQQKVRRWPLYYFWKKIIQPRTCFVGTTVTEYSLFREQMPAKQFAKQFRSQYSKIFPLLIVKDIPEQSPLLSPEENAYSAEVKKALASEQFVEVDGQALAWVPVDYGSLDEYFSRFSSSRRKDFKRKLRRKRELDIEILPSGSPCFLEPDVLDEYYQLYLNVYDQSEIHFDKLSADFFRDLLQDSQANSKIFTYRHQGKLIAYNICLVENQMLIDKYIGLRYPEALHFNVYFISWFVNIEYALQQGLKAYVAGWTDPKVKASLGAKFTFTKHMVYLRFSILRWILKKCSHLFESDHEWRALGK